MLEFIIYSSLFCVIAVPILVFVYNNRARKLNKIAEDTLLDEAYLSISDAIISVIPLLNFILVGLLLITICMTQSIISGIDE